MAVKVDTTLEKVQEAIQKQIDSYKRAINTIKNPDIRAIYEKHLKEAQHAYNTITEVK